MNMGDKVIAFLMGVCVFCAISTLVSYLLYELWNIGEEYFFIIFFICSMIGAVCLMGFAGIILNTGMGKNDI